MCVDIMTLNYDVNIALGCLAMYTMPSLVPYIYIQQGM